MRVLPLLQPADAAGSTKIKPGKPGTDKARQTSATPAFTHNRGVPQKFQKNFS
jgi:hypothetical protein